MMTTLKKKKAETFNFLKRVISYHVEIFYDYQALAAGWFRQKLDEKVT